MSLGTGSPEVRLHLHTSIRELLHPHPNVGLVERK